MFSILLRKRASVYKAAGVSLLLAALGVSLFFWYAEIVQTQEETHVFFVPGSTSPPDSQQALLENVIAQNTAARERVKTAIVELEWETRYIAKEGAPILPAGSKGDRVDTGTRRWLYKDGYYAVRTDRSAQVAESGFLQRNSESLVLNDRYLAFMAQADGRYVSQYDHFSLSEMPEYSKDRCSLYGTGGVLRFGFGTCDEYLNESVKVHPGVASWTISKEPGGGVFRISRFSPLGRKSNQPNTVYIVDPSKDFLITKTTAYENDGHLWADYAVELQRLETGQWFPKVVTQRRSPGIQVTITIKKAVLNSDIPDTEFQLEAILPTDRDKSELRLYRRDVRGATEEMRYQDGAWVPRRMLLQEHDLR